MNLNVMKRIKYRTTLLLSILMLLSVVSCSSKTVKTKNLIEIRTEHANLKIATIKLNKKDDIIDKRAFNYYVNGNIYEELGDLYSAWKSYKNALQIYPNSYQIRYSLASVFFNLKQFGDAIEVLEFINPEDEQVHELRASSYRYIGNTDSAKVSFLRVLKANNRNSSAYSFLSSIYRKEKKIDSVIWAFENLVRLNGKNYRVWNDLSKLYELNGDDSLRESSLLKSLSINHSQTNLMAYVQLGEHYEKLGNRDSAIAVYLNGLNEDENDILLNRLAANFYMSEDSVGQAIKYAEKIVKLSPLDKPASRLLASIYFRADSLDNASKIFKNLISIGDRHPLNFFYMGRISLIEEKYESARDYFIPLTRIADSLPDSWLDLGYAYRMLEDKDGEVENYKTGLSRMKDEDSGVKLLFALGATYEYYELHFKAISVFEELIAKVPDHAQALNYLGYMLVENDMRLIQALKLIKRALDIHPENPAFLDSYGWAYFKMEKYKKALKYLKKAAKTGLDPVIFDHLGDAYKATGDIDSAEVWWKKSLEITPKNKKVLEKLTL